MTGATFYCVPCIANWRGTPDCFLCGEEGQMSEFHDPPGWPVLVLPADWEPAPAPATVLRRARNALRR